MRRRTGPWTTKDRIIREAVHSLLYKLHPYGQRTTLGSVEHLKNPSLKRMCEYYETYYEPNNMAVLISGDIRSHRDHRRRVFSVATTRVTQGDALEGSEVDGQSAGYGYLSC